MPKKRAPSKKVLTQDFLVEIHTEELPPKILQRLANSFMQEISIRLEKTNLRFNGTQYFVTPRRLAVIVHQLLSRQPDATTERKGPAIAAAFDQYGKPTQACIGFARSCGVEPEKLIRIKNPQGEWVGFTQKVAGQSVKELLPDIIQQALAALPIPKRMHWGDHVQEFIRPVHSAMMLYGNDIIRGEILGCNVDRKTEGHRFMSQGWISIANPARYQSTLAKKFVIADFTERKQLIRNQTDAIVKKSLGNNARALIGEELLDEVTGLVEWPVAIMGHFAKEFLQVPQEALISAMQTHQRYFPVVNKQGKLLPNFVTISNIKSKKVQQVIAGNERVLHARLSDAAFFFAVDKKQKLEERLPLLEKMVFQNKLGTLNDKAKRLAKLSTFIAKSLNGDVEKAKRAGLLAKTDLTTHLVGEFPELQGIAGSYYARHDGESAEVAQALYEQYQPKFSGDTLPTSKLGCVLALADRIDLLVGVFGINQPPTGEKDPFGLRRAALGVLRILIEKQLNLNLRELLEYAFNCYAVPLENTHLLAGVTSFLMERLKYFYQEQGIPADVFAAVAAVSELKPYDIHCRLQAVSGFKKLPQAEALSSANKRVSNILAKYEQKIAVNKIDSALFEHDAERVLADKLAKQRATVASLSSSAQYDDVLKQLAHLREPVDAFFDKVLVMTEDKPRRENRLLLLKELRELFLHVADIALLQ
jgi:glycyl-tRNA synthetase beta chain